MKHFLDLEIKHFEAEEFSVDCHPKDSSHHYYLRFRFFYPNDNGSEYEYWSSTLSGCIFKLIQLLSSYALGL